MTAQKRSFITALTAVDSSDKEGVGTIRWEGNKCYKYVKFLNTTATVAGAAGDPVAYTAVDGYGDNEVCIDLSDADAVPVGAGVIVGTITGTAGTAEYGWIQIRGEATVLTAIGTAADGEEVMLTTTDKTLALLTYAGTTPNIKAAGTLFGIAEDASAKTVILTCPF